MPSDSQVGSPFAQIRVSDPFGDVDIDTSGTPGNLVLSGRMIETIYDVIPENLDDSDAGYQYLSRIRSEDLQSLTCM